MALGRVVPPRRAIAASSAREGEKVRSVRGSGSSFWSQSLRDTVLDPILVKEHDYGLKNRCSPSRFKEKSRLEIFNCPEVVLYLRCQLIHDARGGGRTGARAKQCVVHDEFPNESPHRAHPAGSRAATTPRRSTRSEHTPLSRALRAMSRL